MGNHIINDEGAVRVLSPHFLEDHREDGTAHGGVGVVVPPPLEEALEASGLQTMQEYIRQCHANIKEYIIIAPIYELCTGVDALQGTSWLIWWHDKYHSRA